jgi:serine/threonine protein kinase/tetratricopeptide (TPR) repeat protein
VALDDPRVIQAVEEYLAALEAGPRPDRQEFLARRPEIAGALARCLDGLEFVHEAAPLLGQPSRDLPAAPAGPDFQQGVPLGDYRIVREVGRGGMGVVYEAVQLSLGRRVALKVLPFAAALDPRQLQRFKNEAQAAAQLHHTRIVPVYAVGCERGVHFYAMQFIEGRTLADLIRERRRMAGLEGPDRKGPADPAGPEIPLPPSARPGPAETAPQPGAALSTERSTRGSAFFRAAAQLGVQAAEALEHAHQLGVVHRDVKPANLLLDARGDLWVTDFGLAQFHSGAELTLTGDLVGTLRYMSPEQARSRHALVDHRTDIYSLGATLYELLTLEPAFAGHDRHELLRRIAWDEPRPPGRVRKGVPADLETIVLKAMAKNPEERYATARELADDLGRFLNDAPVRARRPSPLQRAARWARRHRALMQATAVALALAAAALAAVAVLLWRAKEQTEAALAQAREQERLAQENGAKAEGRRRQAEAAYAAESAQRRQAEANARLAWQAFPDELFAQALETWGADRPELAEARHQSLLKALHFYEAFARENRDNPALRLETAKAYRRMGDIRRTLEEHRQAEEAYRQALDLQQQLTAAFPAAPEHQEELARSHNNLGLLLEHTGRLREAEQAYRQALERYEKRGDDPPSATAREALAIARLNLGNVLELTGQTQEAEKAFRQAQAALKKLVDEFPEAQGYRRRLAGSQNSLGALLLTRRRTREAERLFRDALELLRPLATDAADPSCRAKLAGVQRNLGILLAATGRTREAEEAYRAALAVSERLAADFPAVPDYRHDLAKIRLHLGKLLAGAGQPREAGESAAQALTALEKLAADFPAVPRFRETLAAAHDDQGALWEAARQTREAEQAYRRALAVRRQLADEAPQAPIYRSHQASTLHHLGILLQDAGRRREAEAAYRQGLTLLEKLAADFPDEPDYPYRLAAIQNSLGVLFQAAGRVQEAESSYRQALTLLDKLADEFPEDAGFQRQQAVGRLNLGNLFAAAGRPGDAVKSYREGLKIDPADAALYDALAWLLATCPEPTVYDPGRAVELAKRAVELAPQVGGYWKTLGVAHGGAGDYKAVVPALERSIELRKGANSFDWFYLAAAHAQLGDKAKANECYRRGVRLMEENRSEDEGLRRFRAKVEQLLGPPEKN